MSLLNWCFEDHIGHHHQGSDVSLKPPVSHIYTSAVGKVYVEQTGHIIKARHRLYEISWSQPTGEVSSGRALDQHSSSYWLWLYLQTRDGNKIHGLPHEWGRQDPATPWQFQQRRRVQPKPHIASCYQNAPTVWRHASGQERTSRGRNLTPPTSPQLRYIYETPEASLTHQIPYDDDWDGPWNVGSIQTPDMADSPRRFHQTVDEYY